jgi:hypothetical protein
MRAELRRLLAVAGSLDAAATSAVMSDEFRVAARARLMRHIAASRKSPPSDPSARSQHPDSDPDPEVASDPWAWSTSPADDDPTGVSPEQPATPASVATRPRPKPLALVGDPSARGQSASTRVATEHGPRTPRVRTRRSKWAWRGAIGAILAAVLAAIATLSASASSLPGQPLYGLKQATEELGVRLAADDQARTLILLRQANARLDETAQLLVEGHTDQVADSTQRFDDALDKATTSFVVTIEAPTDETDDPTTAQLEATFGHQEAQLQTMLASAPEPARAELREALVATERSRAVVADPKPADNPAHVGTADRRSAQVDGVVSVPTDSPPRMAAPSPPHVEDAATHVDDRHEVVAQRALEAHADARDDTPVAVSVRTPTEPSPSGRNSLPVEHLRIPQLAPAPAVVNKVHARGPDTDQPDGDQPPGADDLHASGVAPGVAVTQVAQHPPPRVADDHVATPSPSQSGAHDRVAAEPTPPVTARQSSKSDGGGHASTNAGPPHAATQPETHDPSANVQTAPVTPTPVPAIAVSSAHSGPSSASSPADPHHDAGPATAHTGASSAPPTAQVRSSTVNPGGSGNTANSHSSTTSGNHNSSGGGGSNTSNSGNPRSGGSNSGAGAHH